MKYLSFILVLLLGTLFSGCVTASYEVSYQISLDGVEKVGQKPDSSGIPNISGISENTKYNYSYEDSLVKILCYADNKQIDFSIENKSDYTIEIPWDKAAFMDENGYNHRVIHAGVQYEDMAKLQPSSIIIRKGILDDFVFPTDYIVYISSNEDYDGYYVQSPLLPDSKKCNFWEGYAESPEYKNFVNILKSYIGRTYEVLLPLKVQDRINEYIFKFKVVDVITKTNNLLKFNRLTDF